MKHHDVDPHHFLADVHDIALDRIAADARLARGARPAARAQVRLHQRRRALCPPRARPARHRATISTHLHDIHAAELRAQARRRTAIDLLLDRFGIDPARAVMVEDMAQNLEARQGARHDHGVGRQWLRTRQSRPSIPTFIDHRIADVGEWLDEILEGRRMTDQLARDHRRRVGSARRDRPRRSGEVRDAVEAALAAARQRARRASPRRSTAAGRSTSGSRRRCCCRSGSTRWTRSPAGPAARRGGTRCRRKFARLGRGASSPRPASARCPARSSAAAPTSRPGAVLMPSFVNIGAYVGEGTMIDTWATVGSCAQIGRNVHISGGAGIGGVLEPLQAGPVIIEDDCFIGARSEVAEGVVVEQGAVMSMGVFLGASTKIVDRATGEVMYGRVPAYSVVVPGTLPAQGRRPEPRLRGDRQARRRAHPLQDQHQRAAARLDCARRAASPLRRRSSRGRRCSATLPCPRAS